MFDLPYNGQMNLAPRIQIMNDNLNIAAIIDHTLLKPESTPEMVKQLCREASENSFFSVCILPAYVGLAVDELKDSDVKVCTVAGFPLGANESLVKATETEIAVDQGADEIDMVLNVGLLKAGQTELVKNDIRAVVRAANGKTVKVILETCLLQDSEKVLACQCCVDAGANFVKTSTGFSSAGATVEDVSLMRKTVGSELGVKASGGVRDYDTAIAMINAGANRLGTSSGIAIVSGATAEGDDY